MMPDLSFGWHAAALLVCLAGFVLFALASEREGATLLHRPAAAAEKQRLRGWGWTVLGSSFGFCAWAWALNFGTVLWLGWLSVAAVALIFSLAYWPWREVRKSHARPKKLHQAFHGPSASRLNLALRLLGYVLLLLIPLAFSWAMGSAEHMPAAAVRGTT